MHLPACASISPASFCRLPKHRPFILPFRAPLFFNRMLCRVGIFGTLPILSAEVGQGCSALRTAGEPVDLNRHTTRGGPRFDQFERPFPAGVRKQPLTLADDHREGK